MQTPWGNLNDIDLSSHAMAEQIICADKHQLVEGLVVECIFDQISQKLPGAPQGKILALDIETIVVKTDNSSEPWIALVWARAKSEGLGRYLLALENQFVTYLLEYDTATGFWARKRQSGKSISLESLEALMKRLSARTYTPFNVCPAVRDENRQKQAFWGFISNYYGRELGMKIVVPRLLINCGVQPYFRKVWNLDRIFVAGEQIWLSEVKHKFPLELPPKKDYPTLRFGINEGELMVISRLAESGIDCLHSVLVKPFWSKDKGSMYLLNDLGSRERTALIAVELNRETVHRMMAGRSGTSASHTTITGESAIKYRTLPARAFRELGVLSDPPEDLALRMAATMSRKALPAISEERLRALRTAD